jgi:hypothetical protein
MNLTPERVAALLHDLYHNNIMIESDKHRFRYAQDEDFSLAIGENNLVSLSDVRKRKAFFTVRIMDENQSMIDLILRAHSSCPGRDFFEYTDDELLFPQFKNVQ